MESEKGCVSAAKVTLYGDAADVQQRQEKREGDAQSTLHY
jgi:hypothetical protein